MSPELSNKTADAGTATFVAENHLLGIVQRIVASRDDTRIVLPGKGEIAILPGRNEFHANVQDMPEFCRAPAAHFGVTVFDGAVHTYTSRNGRSIKDLLWQSAFHASQGLLLEGCSKYDVIQFSHWPNLTRLPVTPNAARICALLTRHPTTIMLVHRVLGIDKEEVWQICSAAYSAGIARMISHNPAVPGVDAFAAQQPEPVKERGLFRSMFAKISGL